MIKLFVACLFLCCAVTSAGAQTQPTVVVALPDGSWQHQPTGIIAPGVLADFALNKITDHSEQQLDVVLNYNNADRSIMTFYIYRPAVDSLPLWFDIAQRALQANPKLKSGEADAIFSRFVPPGQQTQSGMLAVYPIESEGYQSTAVAMVPFAGWLIKMRLTSATRSNAQLAAAIPGIFEQIIWPEAMAAARDAVPIAMCEKSLKLKQKVKRFRPTLTDALIAGAAGMAGKDDEQPDEKAAVVYCRDPKLYDSYAIYRANGRKDGYILPLSDAGRAVSVGRNGISGLISGDSRRRYSPAVMLLDRTLNYPDIDKLPTPQTLLDATADDAVVSSVTTWPRGDNTLNIGVPADEND